MGFVNQIYLLDKTECQGCGLFICKQGDYLCKTCNEDFISGIEVELAIEADVRAMAEDEALRKRGWT